MSFTETINNTDEMLENGKISSVESVAEYAYNRVMDTCKLNEGNAEAIYQEFKEWILDEYDGTMFVNVL